MSIDESMILFKGRSSLKQYNPMKPIKRGYKVWSMADMDGYLYKFEIYQGKNQEQNTEDAPKDFGLGDKVVYKMTKFLQKNITKFMRTTSSHQFLLWNTCSHMKFYVVGHCTQTRNIYQKNLSKDSDLKRGEYDYRVSKDDIVGYKWRDNSCSCHLKFPWYRTVSGELKK